MQSSFFDFFISGHQAEIITPIHSRSSFYFRVITFEFIQNRERSNLLLSFFIVEIHMLHHLAYSFTIFMKLIMTALILYPLADQYSECNAYGKAANINKGRTFVLVKVSLADLEIVSKH